MDHPLLFRPGLRVLPARVVVDTTMAELHPLRSVLAGYDDLGTGDGMLHDCPSRERGAQITLVFASEDWHHCDVFARELVRGFGPNPLFTVADAVIVSSLLQ